MSLRSLEDLLHTTATVKKIERTAIEASGFSVAQLMTRASKAVLEELLQEFGEPRELTVFCGTGNNAGDGYTIAALAVNEGISVRVVEVGDRSKMLPYVAHARSIAEQAAVDFCDCQTPPDLDRGIIVDALLGIGAAIAEANASLGIEPAGASRFTERAPAVAKRGSVRHSGLSKARVSASHSLLLITATVM